MIIQQALPLPSLKCTEAAKICCKKFCNCSGRARRSEFWYFVLLFNILILIPYFMIAFFAITEGKSSRSRGMGLGLILSLVLYILTICIMSIPLISASIRRLHDTGKSGFFLLISIIPIVGIILLIIMLCQDSELKTNMYGECPKYSIIQNSTLIDNGTNQVYQVPLNPAQPQSSYQSPYQFPQPQYQNNPPQIQYQYNQPQPQPQPQSQYQYNKPHYQYNQPGVPQGYPIQDQNSHEVNQTPNYIDNAQEPAPLSLPLEHDLIPKPTASPY